MKDAGWVWYMGEYGQYSMDAEEQVKESGRRRVDTRGQMMDGGAGRVFLYLPPASPSCLFLPLHTAAFCCFVFCSESESHPN